MKMKLTARHALAIALATGAMLVVVGVMEVVRCR
jgi:hypothetical protein